MVLPNSGSISLLDIQNEFGGSNPIGLDEYYRSGGYVTSNNTNVPTNGSINFSNFYGAFNEITENFTVNYNFGTQRENDYRSATIVSGLTGYTSITATMNYYWTQGGNVWQTIYIRDSNGSNVTYKTGYGTSGSVTISTTLDISKTYNIFVDASSNLGATYAVLTAYGSINYQTKRPK